MLRIKLRDLNQFLTDRGLCFTDDKEIEADTD